MPIKTYQLTLKWAEKISPHVRHLAFSPDDVELLNYTPGQFITIHFEKDGKTLRRSYSIASVPGNSDLIEIAAGFVEDGPGTELLFGLEPGDSVNATGPFGRLVLKDEPVKRLILMSTSTGVTPYRCMLPELARRMDADPELQVVILEGVQYRADLLYGEEFLAFAQQHPRVQFRAHFSRDDLTDARTHEHGGYVQSALAELQPDPENDIVYLCGNPGMIDDAFELLKTHGFDFKNVRREKYISK